ncbi:BON domain-containing protein [Burkholderia multivorans]|uniref:BON domain-containing protein n=2 Tax=Burkholderia multivorans TaxID=87883 RepID=A0AB37AUL5_9BURK|nr:BON domain-containing protein [Burkholderia multivorans]PRE50932.1 BON domain-containing protein [Burkholderia multivorans]
MRRYQCFRRLVGAAVTMTALGVQMPIAHATSPVGSFHHVKLDPAARAANRRLAKAVSHALGHTPGIDATNVTVRARSGMVVLGGSVPDAAQIDRATAVARQVNGVTDVKNTLTVREAGQ